jgi:hypothetical protein
MLRGLVTDPEAPAGARVRAPTALMDRAGLTPAYAVEVGHWDEQQAHQATELQDPQVMARQILEALAQVVAMLPPLRPERCCSEWRGSSGTTAPTL